MGNTSDLLGAHEIEDEYGLNRMQVSRLMKSGDFPQPFTVIRAGRLWHIDDVREAVGKLTAAGRLRGGKVIPKQYARAET